MTDKLKQTKIQKSQLVILLIAFAVIGSLALLVTRAAAPAVPSGYSVVFEDDFDGSSVNLSNWGVYHNTYGDGNNEEACLTPNNVLVSSGTLKIVSKREQVACPGRSPDDFTSGFIATRSIGSSGSSKTAQGNYFPKYARYEMRAKLPHAQGVWPGFWLRHTNGSATAEIDVMEYFHAQVPGETSTTLHLDNNTSVAHKTVNFESPTSNPQWHTWAVEIAPDTNDSSKARLTFYLDGNEFFAVTPNEQNWTNQGNPDEMFDIAINTAVGGNWVGHPDDPLGWSRYLNKCISVYPTTNSQPCPDTASIQRADFPETYEIDYVRVMVKDGSTPPPPPPPPTKLATVSGLSTTPEDGQITLNWDAVNGADNYTVRWGTGGSWTTYSNDIGSNPSSNSYTVTGLTNGTTYNFSVAARDSSGTLENGDYSSAINGTPQAGNPTPTKLGDVTGLSVSEGDGQVTLDWNDVSGANNYTVRWGTGGNWTEYSNASGDSNNPTSSNYTVTGLNNGTTYNFSVAARDSTNTYEKGDYSSAVNGTPVAPQQSQPGDTDGDTDVDIADLSKLLSDWDPQGNTPGSPADFNNDGKVDVVDLSVLLSNYGN